MDMNKEGLLSPIDLKYCFEEDIETPFRSLRLDLARGKRDLRLIHTKHKTVINIFKFL
jgi:hypothetical protein